MPSGPGWRGRTGRRWFRGRRRWLVVLLVAVVGVAVESVPGVPGYDASALSAELVASDAGAVASRIDPFDSQPHNPCARIEASYGVGNHLLKDDGFGFYASIWPSYQALNAFYLASLLPGDGQCARDFDRTLRAVDDTYWSDALGGSPAAYDQGPAALHIPGDLPRVDDSLWMGVTLSEAYDRTGKKPLLERAEGVFALGRANWDPRRGGIYWEDHAPGATDLDKAVVSNAPAAITAIDIYLATGRRSYLDWGEKIVGWLRTHLFDRSDDLYDDHIDDHRSPPVVGRAKFTYNQGIMVGALGLLSTISPSAYPLRDAVALAQRAMRYFRSHHSYGQPAFDVVWARNVLWLASLYHRPSFTAQARASLRAAIGAEPKSAGSLLDVASEMALDELTKLAPARYGRLAP